MSTSGPDVTVSRQETTSPPPLSPASVMSSAQVTGIDVSPDDAGFTDIQVTTSDPVLFDTVWQTDTQLDLILFNARIPEYVQKPWETRYAGTAVDRVLPHPGYSDDMNAKIEILIREKVPYRVVQDKTGFFAV